ncbi:hypothetical protein PGB28_00960 [Primorskyibacter aestuariivivens]|uniref:hypothetical protein n=1 Tax=Primorskyibacter aestuariivivens TaxID=1888912 RepID=UPI0023004BB3|nr:hypothetical protein [Primorskyibacter aestuariivivens]MDA7427009.1 hypothetical protein [Primorskyibacter aestuariivivens]
MKRFALPLAVLPALAAAEAQAQQAGFHPDDNCIAVLSKTDSYTATMVAAWVFGYVAGKTGDFKPVDVDNNNAVLGNVINACKARPQLTMRQLVDGHKKPGADTPGSEADARLLLSKFLVPGADLAALTWSLKPTEAEIRTVYADPLASKLIALYNQMYQPGVKLEPKPEYTDLWMVRATTAQMRRGDAVLRDFPGGYKKVRGAMMGDFPVVYFKFVRPGETSGLAFDGLVHVNNRWVLMPKPWRALDGG